VSSLLPCFFLVVFVAGFLFSWLAWPWFASLEATVFHLFVQLLPLLSPSGPSLRARSATIEEKKSCRVSFCCVGFSICVVCEVKGFHTFCTLFFRFSYCQNRALERDRPQQRKKMGRGVRAAV
jgi:hypothetical protein